ncbi:MAG: sigma factor [Ilumatobacteraceae bacterium]
MSGRARSIDPLLDDHVVTVDELYRVHRERLTRLAASVTFDRSLAEEIVQDAFAGLQQRFGRVSDPVGYLQRSVINRGVSALRRRRVAQRYVPPPTIAGGAGSRTDRAA